MRLTLLPNPMFEQIDTALVDNAVLKLRRGPISMKHDPFELIDLNSDLFCDIFVSKFGVRIHFSCSNCG